MDDIDYLRGVLGPVDEGFFDYLLTLDCSKIKLYAMREGTYSGFACVL